MQKRGMTITLTTIRGVLYLQRTHDVRVNTLAHPVKTVADEPNTHAKIHAHLLPHLLETPVQKMAIFGQIIIFWPQTAIFFVKFTTHFDRG